MIGGQEFTHAEFQELSNRSEKAFWFLMNGPVHWSAPNWNASRLVKNRNAYQRALAVWGKERHGNGKLDEVQLRAVEHLSWMDKMLWRIFAVIECRRDYKSVQSGEKWWLCGTHGSNKGDAKPCQKAYEEWLATNNY